ncbi:CHAT domain-containing protein [Bradyrhizobium sp. UFLA05-153]
MSVIICRPKILQPEMLANAERRALAINPANEIERHTVTRTPIGRRGGARRIAVVIGRKWPAKGVQLSVSFMDGAKSNLRKRILLHMNAWGQKANVKFAETSGVGQVRIARLDSPEDQAGYWSYVGTEILEIPEDQPTMNLEGFTMRTSEAEFRRVVRHEAGHTLGFDHEHMRSDIVKLIDRDKAIRFFDKDQGWLPEEVEEQVLTPLANKSIMGTKESDPLSIMCYQLPAAIMKNGKPIKGGKDINPTDHAFAASLYPKKSRTATPLPFDIEDITQPPAESAEPGSRERPEATTPPGPGTGAPSPAAHSGLGNVFELVIMDEFRPNRDTPRSGETPQFARVLASYGGARVTSVMPLHAGDGGEKTQFGNIIRTHQRIKKYTNREAGSLPGDKDMIAFGEQLFDTLFQGDVRRLYDEARTRQGRKLDFIFTSMIPWIAEKPWEFAYDPGRKCFLATEEMRFTRNVLTSIPADQINPGSGPLRILVASAQPVGYARLSIEQEEAVIRRGFEPLIAAGLVTVTTLARATPIKLHGYLSNGEFDVVHFIGHGTYDEERGEGRLVFVNEQGQEHSLGERSVRELFCRRNLSLVFLNACETGAAGRAEFNKGVAQSLVAHGLPAVVANQYSVLDSSATSFAQHFYWSLAQGNSLGESAREARIAVNYSLHGEPIDWAVPVLYARDSSLVLCRPPTKRSFVPETRVRPDARRATAAHSARIAVWDMDNDFPALDRTLAQMNASQKEFGFELVRLSVPLDVWELQEGKTMFLWAERLADRLRGMPVELEVDILACITRHWMRSNEWENIYGWWPSNREPPILIRSVAGFDELSPEGPITDRVVANGMVAGLAGFYGDLDGHEGGSKRCPLFFNEKREFKYIAARQQFDEDCRKKLKGLGAKLDALDALLNVFP